jgi:hypothetical protein
LLSVGIKTKNLNKLGMGDDFMETSPIEVQKALKGMDYPAKKEKLIKQAKNNDASQEVMKVLENLPDKEYENAVDVSKEFKGEGGGRGGSRGGQEHGGRSGGRGGEEESGKGGRGGSRGGGEEEGGREGNRGGQGSHGGGRGQDK